MDCRIRLAGEVLASPLSPTLIPPLHDILDWPATRQVGSMAIFDSWGVRHPVTVLQLDECEVVQVRNEKWRETWEGERRER